MARLFSRFSVALARTIEIAQRCRFSLDELAYQYPDRLGLATPAFSQVLGRIILLF